MSTKSGAILVSAGAVCVVVGTFLPWVESGSASRSSYEVFDLLDRLGFSPDGIVGAAMRLWPLLPLLVVLSVIANWWPSESRRWTTTRLALTIVSAVYAGAVAITIANAPHIALFRVGRGTIVTLVGAILMLVGAGVTVFSATRRGTGARPSAPAGGRS